MAIIIYDIYDSQNGVNPTEMVETTKHRLLSKSESTQGKSAT